ncbi:MAG: winged helix-turn-helix domain-containing tetratricopeptide repeat protein [Terriglobia bacterium]
MPNNSPISKIHFDVFELDLKDGELRKECLAVKLAPQPFKILALLASRQGQIVAREEIQRVIWGDETFVDFDVGLNQCIRQIRAVLGDDAQNPRFIETLSRRGYRFIAPVEPVKEEIAPEVTTSESGNVDVTGFPPVRIDLTPDHLISVRQEAPITRGKGVRNGLASRLGVKRTLGIAAAAFLVAIVVIAVIFEAFGPKNFWTELLRRGQEKTIRSLAVLPFRNLSGDVEQEYFAEGMTDQLITNLAQIPSIRVVSLTSVMRYRKAQKSLPIIARELNVDAIVEGTVTRWGDHVRVTAQLVQAEPEKHLWAKSYERSMGDALNLQGEVAEAIATAIRVKLTPQERTRIGARHPSNPAAEAAYFKGHYYFEKSQTQWNRGADAPLNRSIEYFQQATAIDPRFSLAYTELATAYDMLLMTDAPDPFERPADVSAKAKAAALKAIEIDNASVGAHSALAWARFVYDWDWTGAEAEFTRAIDLNPGFSTGHYWYAMFLTAMGRQQEAMTHIRRAEELDPVSPSTRLGGAWIFYHARRYDEAIQEDRAALALNTNSARAHYSLGWACVKIGSFQQAASEFKTGARLSGGDTQTLWAYGAYLDAVSGKREDSLKMLRLLNAQRKPSRISPYVVAEIYAALGDRDRAFSSLETAYRERRWEMVYLEVDPDLDRVHTDPRFAELVRRMNLPPHRQLAPAAAGIPTLQQLAPPDDLEFIQ